MVGVFELGSRNTRLYALYIDYSDAAKKCSSICPKNATVLFIGSFSRL